MKIIIRGVIELAIIYGAYKKARNAYWQALIDNKIDRLSVDIVRIVCDNGKLLLKNSKSKELCNDEAGISIFDGKQWFLVYDDSLSIGRKRFTVAHKLGHIFLGHPLIAGFHARILGEKLPQTESEANIFASRFLASACVLWGLDIHTAEDIERVCEISGEAAEFCAKHMEELYKRNMFWQIRLNGGFKSIQGFYRTKPLDGGQIKISRSRNCRRLLYTKITRANIPKEYERSNTHAINRILHLSPQITC